MSLDNPKYQDIWSRILATLPADDSRIDVTPNAFGFGGEGALGDALAALVPAGCERATTSLPVAYTLLGEAVPKPGDHNLVLDGAGEPVAIIERTREDAVPCGSVTAAFAVREREDDGSLASWRTGHVDFFRRVCPRPGGCLDEATITPGQTFDVVWPSADRQGDPATSLAAFGADARPSGRRA